MLEYAFVRTLINVIGSGLYLLIMRINFFDGLTRKNMVYFAARALIGHIGNITFIWMFKLLPLGIGSTIVYSNPIMITFMSHFLLNESATRVEVAAIFASFLGIVLLSFGK